MQLKIQNGVVELSGEPILKNATIEINDRSHIAVVGRNGCGKTTLLKLISGEYSIVKADSDNSAFFTVSGHPKIGTLTQMTFKDDSLTLVEEIRSAYSEILSVKERLSDAQTEMELNGTEENIKNYTNLLDTFTNLGGFYFEKEYEAAIKKFGFSDEEKYRRLSEFSGGQRTKIAFLKLLLSKPDILLLDEPTNHLDIYATLWLEEYLKEYKKAFVVVSHDRMFLDNVANEVYEIEHGKTHRYIGNYTAFCSAKRLVREQQAKEYEAQQKELKRLQDLADRFRYKATKAAMAQSKLKAIDRMELIEAPESYDMRTFHADFQPDDIGVKDMLSVKDLCIGFTKPLSTVNLEVKLGNRIGIIGGNGLGKSTFLKTLMGEIPPLSGSFKFAPRATVGYFDQQMAQHTSSDSVLDDFLKSYPHLTDFEARSALGAFMFSGEDVFKTVNMLSGGERVRLALCKILKKKPNFLILDEPTNHMDIVGKETLEDMLKDYNGTLIFVSHDRYFISKIADSLLHFNENGTELYPYGYSQYLEAQQKKDSAPVQNQIKENKPKKGYTTPLKEKARREKAIKKAEDKIALLEEEINSLNEQLNLEENISDYVKLSELQNKLCDTETELEEVMLEWENLCEQAEE